MAAADYSYIFAKVCGAYSRAAGKDALVRAISSDSMIDLWRSLFGTTAPDSSAAGLRDAIEGKTREKARAEFDSLAKAVGVNGFFECLVRKEEFGLVKKTLVAVRDGAKTRPCDFHRSSPVVQDAYPDLSAMFSRTRYAWIAPETPSALQAAENRLDLQYYSELWASIATLPHGKAEGLRDLVALEAEMQNVIWALRLRYYYYLEPPRISEQLIELSGRDVSTSAMESFAFRFGNPEDWKGWKWAGLVFTGDFDPGSVVDVRAVERNSLLLLQKRIRQALHFHPFSVVPLYCFYKLKEFEVSLVTGVLEGLYMHMPRQEILDFIDDMTGSAA